MVIRPTIEKTMIVILCSMGDLIIIFYLVLGTDLMLLIEDKKKEMHGGGDTVGEVTETRGYKD